MKLYSNEDNKRLISLLTAKGREPHSVIITGERGSGRRTLAKYLAEAMMCERHTGEPCGVCRSCRMLEDGNHPDFITAQANENDNYRLDDIRALVSDSVIKPNEGDFKFYLIPDFDRSVNTAVQVQNVLLKFIEEPPPHCVVMLTSATKEIFLPTVLSRCMIMGTERCTRHDAEEWLTIRGGFGQDDIIRAVSCCGGNFGRCLEFLTGKELPAAFECAKAVAEAITAKDEYMILRGLFMCDGQKAVLKQALGFLAEILRGACLTGLGLTAEDCCCGSGAARLAEKLGSTRAEELYRVVTEYAGRLDSNCNQALTVNSLTGEIITRL